MRAKLGLLRTALGSTTVLFGAIWLAAGAAPSPAAAVPDVYPPPPVGLQLSTALTSPGSTIQVTGEGCAAGSTVTVTLRNSESVELGTTTANGQGSFSISVTIPLNTTPGEHEVVATCGPLSMSSQLIIASSAAALPTSAHGPLPLTGWDTRAPLLAGLALIMFGSSAVLAARKRRHRRHA